MRKIDIVNINTIHLLFKDALSDNALKEPLSSLDTLGILSPLQLVCYQQINYLIDGFGRYTWAQSNNIFKIPVCIHTCDTLADIFTFIQAFKPIFFQHPVMQARIIKLLQCRFPQLSSNHAILLDMSQSQAIAHDASYGYSQNIKKLSQLNHDILTFCWRKKFSFTHLKKIILFKPETLTRLIVLNDQLHWSAAAFIKAASFCDHLSDLSLQNELNDILSISPHLKTHTKQLQAAFLERLNYHYRPTLAKIQKRIAMRIDELKLPKNISLNWDKSLELREIILNISIRKKNSLHKTLNVFDEKILCKIDQILDML